MRISDWSSDVCSSDLFTDRPTFEIEAQRDDAITVVAIDLRGAAGHRDVSDIVERHRSALIAADGQLPDRFRGSARRRIQLHAHVDLTAGQAQPSGDRKSTRLNSSH